MNHIEDVLTEIDRLWRPEPNAARILLRIIGQTALYLQVDYDRGTKDGDVLETSDVAGAVRAQLEALGGKGTKIAQQFGIYIEIVGAAVPLLPVPPVWHGYPMSLKHFDTVVLDIADVLVSKLIRYSSTDRDDIRAMIDGGHVTHERLCERFENMIDRQQFQARANRLPEMVDRFNEIERDYFFLSESRFDLHPSVHQ